ncbi:MAG: hypothetical protein MJ237_07060 [bacterium]|nr:hypothetical protein [bacterium]
MKKLLSVVALAGVIGFCMPSANAFSWSNLNPAYWGHCPKCEKQKKDCGCKKMKQCDPCDTGYAAPCDPCAKKVKKHKCDPCMKQQTTPCEQYKKTQECDPCNKLQQMNQ